MSEADNVVQGLFDAEKWQSALVKNANGATIECWQNVYTVLKHHPAWMGVVGFDAFAQRVMKRKPVDGVLAEGPWSPDDDYKVGLWLAQQLKFTVKAIGNLTTGIGACAAEQQFHPVRDWLNALTWDGTARMDDWLADALGAKKTRYTIAVGRYFLLNMVARIYDPGCIMRSVPVLEGAQNRGKSEALRILAEPWFSDAHLEIGTRDASEMIQGCWINEIPEMHAFSRAETTKVKHFVSVRQDSWVPKYIRGRITVPRQVVFAGTTNENLYLRDWTGNTRFWPLRCEEEGEIDLDCLRETRAQLFAEAVVEYRKKVRRHPSREEEADLFAPEQEARLMEHHWHSPISHWLASNRFARVTAHEVLKDGLGVDNSKLTAQMHAEVGKVMARIGWPREREKSGLRDWFYIRPSTPSEPEKLPKAGDSKTVEKPSGDVPF